MMKPPKPANEAERLAALLEAEILDTLPEEEYDKITELIAKVCGTEFCVISFIDEERQWFKSKVGFNEESTTRDAAICAHTILNSEILEVNNALTDSRFVNIPSVAGEPHVRFYAGAPLITSEGHALGTLCVFSPKVRVLEEFQREALRVFAKKIIALIEQRKK